MAYGDIYSYTFTSRLEGDVEVIIQEDGGSGPPKSLEPHTRGHTVTSYSRSREDDFAPFLISQTEISVIDRDASQVDRALGDLLIASDDPEKYRIRIKRLGVTQWYGFIIPGSVSQPEDYLSPLTMTAIDGIGLLKDKPYVDGAGDLFTGRATVTSIIVECLNKLGFALDFYIACDWYAGGVSQGLTAADNPLDEYFIDRFIYRKSQKFQNDPVPSGAVKRFNASGEVEIALDTPMSCKEVLEDICNRFSLQICQRDGGWRIYQPDLRDRATIRWWKYSPVGIYQATLDVNPRRTVGTEMEERSPATRSSKRPISAAEIIYNHGQAQLLKNPTFDFIESGANPWVNDWTRSSLNIFPVLLDNKPNNKREFDFGVSIPADEVAGTAFAAKIAPTEYISQFPTIKVPEGDTGLENQLVFTTEFQPRLKNPNVALSAGTLLFLPIRIVFRGDLGTDYALVEPLSGTTPPAWTDVAGISGGDVVTNVNTWYFHKANIIDNEDWLGVLLETPDLPDTGTVDVWIGGIQAIVTIGDLAAGNGVDKVYLDNARIRLRAGDAIGDTIRTSITNYASRDEDKKFTNPPVQIGDGPSTAHRGTLTFDAAGTDPTHDWKISPYTVEADSDDNIGNLQARLYLETMWKPRATHSADYFDFNPVVSPDESIYRGGRAFGFSEVRKDWQKSLVSGEFYHIQKNSIADDFDTDHIGGGGTLASSGGSTHFFANALGQGLLGDGARKITETDALITAGAKTSISVNQMTEALVNSGDKLVIVSPKLDIFQVVSSADQIPGATSLSINSFNFPVDVPYPAAILKVEEEIITSLVMTERGFRVTSTGGPDLFVKTTLALGAHTSFEVDPASQLDIPGGAKLTIKRQNGQPDVTVTTSLKVRRSDTVVSIASKTFEVEAGDAVFLTGHVSQGQLEITRNSINLSVEGQGGGLYATGFARLASRYNGVSVDEIDVDYADAEGKYSGANTLGFEFRAGSVLTLTGIEIDGDVDSLGAIFRVKVDLNPTLDHSGSDGSVTINNPTFASAGSTFTAADVGKFIRIAAGSNAGDHLIIEFVNANTLKVQADFVATESPITFTVRSPIYAEGYSGNIAIVGSPTITAESGSLLTLSSPPSKAVRNALNISLDGIEVEADRFASSTWDGEIDANGKITNPGTKGWALSGGGDASITGTLHFGGGAGVAGDDGITFDPLSGKWDGPGLNWDSATNPDVAHWGTEVDLGAVVGFQMEFGTSLTIKNLSNSISLNTPTVELIGGKFAIPKIAAPGAPGAGGYLYGLTGDSGLWWHANGASAVDLTAGTAATSNAISPEDYGATGDGVTDDTTEFDLAWVAHYTNGWPLVLPGKYLITSPLTVPPDSAMGKINVFGWGRTAQILYKPTNWYDILFRLNFDDVFFRDVYVKGDEALFEVDGTDTLKGVAWWLGDGNITATDSSSRSGFYNCRADYCRWGLVYERGWSNDFYGLQTNFNRRGVYFFWHGTIYLNATYSAESRDTLAIDPCPTRIPSGTTLTIYTSGGEVDVTTDADTAEGATSLPIETKVITAADGDEMYDDGGQMNIINFWGGRAEGNTEYGLIGTFRSCSNLNLFGYLSEGNGTQVWTQPGGWKSGQSYTTTNSLGDDFYVYTNPGASGTGYPQNLYKCILAHTSSASNKPESGASWTTYWAAAVGDLPYPSTSIGADIKIDGFELRNIYIASGYLERGNCANRHIEIGIDDSIVGTDKQNILNLVVDSTSYAGQTYNEEVVLDHVANIDVRGPSKQRWLTAFRLGANNGMWQVEKVVDPTVNQDYLLRADVKEKTSNAVAFSQDLAGYTNSDLPVTGSTGITIRLDEDNLWRIKKSQEGELSIDTTKYRSGDRSFKFGGTTTTNNTVVEVQFGDADDSSWYDDYVLNHTDKLFFNAVVQLNGGSEAFYNQVYVVFDTSGTEYTSYRASISPGRYQWYNQMEDIWTIVGVDIDLKALALDHANWTPGTSFIKEIRWTFRPQVEVAAQDSNQWMWLDEVSVSSTQYGSRFYGNSNRDYLKPWLFEPYKIHSRRSRTWDLQFDDATPFATGVNTPRELVPPGDRYWATAGLPTPFNQSVHNAWTWYYYGGASQNSIIETDGPKGYNVRVWQGNSDGSSANLGGFYTKSYKIDPGRTYYTNLYYRATTDPSVGNTYYGYWDDSSPSAIGLINHQTGAADDNPYAWSGDLPAINTWYLIRSIIHTKDSTNETIANERANYDIGIFNCETGEKVAEITRTFRWASTNTNLKLRAFRSDATLPTGVKIELYYPSIQEADGHELQASDLVQFQSYLKLTGSLADNAVMTGDGTVSSLQATGVLIDDNNRVSGIDRLDISPSSDINAFRLLASLQNPQQITFAFQNTEDVNDMAGFRVNSIANNDFDVYFSKRISSDSSPQDMMRFECTSNAANDRVHSLVPFIMNGTLTFVSGNIELNHGDINDVENLILQPPDAVTDTYIYFRDDTGATKKYIRWENSDDTLRIGTGGTDEFFFAGIGGNSSAFTIGASPGGSDVFRIQPEDSGRNQIFFKDAVGAIFTSEMLSRFDKILQLKDNVTTTGNTGYLSIYANASGSPVYRVGTGAESNFGNLFASAVINDHRIIRGDGGLYGAQESVPSIDDSGNILSVESVTIKNAQSTPQVKFLTDTDTGLRHSASDTLNLHCGGADIFQATASAARFKKFFDLDSEALQVSSGAVTPTVSIAKISSESAVPDDLDTINAGTDGRVLLLILDTASLDSVTLTENGNIVIEGASTQALSSDSFVLLTYFNGKWRVRP